MKTFVTSEIETFLRAIDRHLSEPFDIIIIGGAAAALAYRVVDYTKDIDTWSGRSLAPIADACKKAQEETGLNIPIGPAGPADGPYEYEDRIQKVDIEGLKKLRVFVPEKHDLALMKIMRANENDIATIKQLNANFGLDYELLVKRFKEEMTHVIGSSNNIKLNFITTIESVFGEKVAEEVEKQIRDWKN